jgi:hypothetical protein
LVPLGTAFVYQVEPAGEASRPPSLENTVGDVTAAEQVKTLFRTAHFPLLDVRVNPDPLPVAVKVAHAPLVYQVPPLIIQPFCWPPLVTNRVPLPEKGLPGAPVGAGPDFVVVLGGDGRLPVFGRYLIPVAGQSDLAPSGLVGTNVPVCRLPLTW